MCRLVKKANLFINHLKSDFTANIPDSIVELSPVDGEAAICVRFYLEDIKKRIVSFNPKKAYGFDKIGNMIQLELLSVAYLSPQKSGV